MPGIEQLARRLARVAGLIKRPDRKKNIHARIVVPGVRIEVAELNGVRFQRARPRVFGAGQPAVVAGVGHALDAIALQAAWDQSRLRPMRDPKGAMLI